jgi:hypothetical protein
VSWEVAKRDKWRVIGIFLTQVGTLSAPASYLLGNALRDWPLEWLIPRMTVTPSRGNELNRVQILLEAFATALERGIRHRDAIAIEQSPDQIDEIQTASGDARLSTVTGSVYSSPNS